MVGRAADHRPGKLLVTLEPDATRLLAARLPLGSVVISATNGKTTTTSLTVAVLRAGGLIPVHNPTGANLRGGVATALAVAARGRSRMDGDVGVFEVDEGQLTQVVGQLDPRVILLGNLFRDQLNRYGELDRLADRWLRLCTMHAGRATLILNADDPTVAGLGRELPGCMYFGIEDWRCGRPARDHAFDAHHCRRCDSAYRFSTFFLGHLSHYECSVCGWQRPQPQIFADRITVDGTGGTQFRLCTPDGTRDIRLGLVGLHNVYNALAAAAIGHALGVQLPLIASALAASSPVWGRGERFEIAGRRITVTLVKNPAGANAFIRSLTTAHHQLDILGVLNDRDPDARDVSWIWDADFEALAPHIRSVTCSGRRAADLALRFKYTGVPTERIAVNRDVSIALALTLLRGGTDVHVLATYTGMFEIRSAVKRMSRPL